MKNVALRIADNLNLYMLRAPYVAFQEYRVISKRSARFLTCLLQLRRKIGRGIYHSHAASAASKGCLDDERESNLLGNASRVFIIRIDRILSPGDDRNTCRLREAACSGLISQSF